MKKIFIISFLLFLALFINAYSYYDYTFFTIMDHIDELVIGKATDFIKNESIKAVTITHYKQKKLFESKLYIEYNANAQIIKYIYSGEDRMPLLENRYTYYDDGAIMSLIKKPLHRDYVKEVEYYDNRRVKRENEVLYLFYQKGHEDFLVETQILEFDDNDDLVKKTKKNFEDKITREIFYDTRGNEIRKINYNYTNGPDKHIEYIYNDSNNLLEMIEYVQESGVSKTEHYRETTEYTDTHTVVMTSYKKSKLYQTTTYSKNDAGDIVEIVIKNNKGVVTDLTTLDINYNDDGLIISIQIESGRPKAFFKKRKTYYYEYG